MLTVSTFVGSTLGEDGGKDGSGENAGWKTWGGIFIILWRFDLTYGLWYFENVDINHQNYIRYRQWGWNICRLFKIRRTIRGRSFKRDGSSGTEIDDEVDASELNVRFKKEINYQFFLVFARTLWNWSSFNFSFFSPVIRTRSSSTYFSHFSHSKEVGITSQGNSLYPIFPTTCWIICFSFIIEFQVLRDWFLLELSSS